MAALAAVTMDDEDPESKEGSSGLKYNMLCEDE